MARRSSGSHAMTEIEHVPVNRHLSYDVLDPSSKRLATPLESDRVQITLDHTPDILPRPTERKRRLDSDPRHPRQAAHARMRGPQSPPEHNNRDIRPSFGHPMNDPGN